jgi:Icc-related predicted phosphoesterase
MRIVAMSDTHGYHEKVEVTECDLLLHAGDFSWKGQWSEVEPFLEWFAKQPAKHKVLIPGNHEVMMSKAPGLLRMKCKELGIHFLINEHVVIDGKKIFGSPYSVRFGNWAYGLEDNKLQEIWNMIEPDTNIILVHGPPKGILDRTNSGENAGSETLYKTIQGLLNLQLVVCGHIHEDRGCVSDGNVTYINAAICGIPYNNLTTPRHLKL